MEMNLYKYMAVNLKLAVQYNFQLGINIIKLIVFDFWIYFSEWAKCVVFNGIYRKSPYCVWTRGRGVVVECFLCIIDDVKLYRHFENPSTDSTTTFLIYFYYFFVILILPNQTLKNVICQFCEFHLVLIIER